MAISTILDSSKLIETLQKMIYEWLNTILSGDVEGVYPRIIQDTETGTMEKPWCEYILSVPVTAPTGGGALGNEGRFKHCRCEIAFRMKRPGSDLLLVLLGDKLDDQFRSPSLGRPHLGQAGLRQASLIGPIPDNDKNYYLQRWFLDFRVLATNA